jgi:hypothetical protein
MKKTICFLGIICLGIFPCKAQLIAYGLQGGLIYSHISLSAKDPYLTTSGSSIGYQLGLFIKKDVGHYFLQIEPTYAGNMGGDWVINDVKDNVKVSGFCLPVIIGKKFMTGVRVFTGLAPYINIGIEEETSFSDFYMNNTSVTSFLTGGGGFELKYLLGAGFEISKIAINLRYEFSMLGDFTSHEVDDNTIHHRLPLAAVQLAYKFN